MDIAFVCGSAQTPQDGDGSDRSEGCFRLYVKETTLAKPSHVREASRPARRVKSSKNDSANEIRLFARKNVVFASFPVIYDR